MRRFLASIIFLCALALTVGAQSVTMPQQAVAAPALRFGYVSCDSVLHSLPQYKEAVKSLNNLKKEYDDEMKRVEEEFNMKYELFLEQQSELAPSIRQKRQEELQELMEKNTAFKEEANHLLAKARHEAISPLRSSVKAAISHVARRLGLAFVLNTDNDALPFVDQSHGIDITSEVRRSVK